MSNTSSPITPNYGSDEYNRVLAGIPMEVESSPDSFFSPPRVMRNAALVYI